MSTQTGRAYRTLDGLSRLALPADWVNGALKPSGINRVQLIPYLQERLDITPAPELDPGDPVPMVASLNKQNRVTIPKAMVDALGWIKGTKLVLLWEGPLLTVRVVVL